LYFVATSAENSERTAGNFAVISAAGPSATQDFRRDPLAGRCKFPGKTAKIAKTTVRPTQNDPAFATGYRHPADMAAHRDLSCKRERCDLFFSSRNRR